MNLRASGSPSIMAIGNVVVFFPWIGDVLSYFYAGSKIACGSSSFRFNFCRPSRVSQFILIVIFEILILSIFSYDLDCTYFFLMVRAHGQTKEEGCGSSVSSRSHDSFNLVRCDFLKNV